MNAREQDTRHPVYRGGGRASQLTKTTQETSSTQSHGVPCATEWLIATDEEEVPNASQVQQSRSGEFVPLPGKWRARPASAQYPHEDGLAA